MPLPTASVSLTCWNKDVYEPSDDTFLLTDAVQGIAEAHWSDAPPTTVVEVGCGSGFVICSVALMLRHCGKTPRQVIAVDHNAAALQATRDTLAAHQVACQVELVQGDLCRPLQQRLAGCIDLLLFNPPYVPTPDDEWTQAATHTDVASAWAGGYAGRRVIDRFLPQVADLLSPSGELLLMTVTENDPLGIVNAAHTWGLKGSVFMSRAADEESLTVLRLRRKQDAAPTLDFP